MAAAHPAAQAPAYTYTRPATIATRSLIDSSQPSPQGSGHATPSDPISPHGTLHRRKTNNYETALADRLAQVSDSSLTAPTSESTATPEPVHTHHHHQRQHHDGKGGEEHKEDNPVISSTGLAYRGDAAAAQVGHPIHEPLSPSKAAGLREQQREGNDDGQDSGRPLLGVLGRQQSFKQSDQKRAAMERMLSTEDVPHRRGGYTSSQPGTPV